MLFHARSMALAAATQGAQVARAYGSSPAAGKTKAEDFLEVEAVDPVASIDLADEHVGAALTHFLERLFRT